MKLVHLISIKFKNSVINFAQVLARKVNGGLSTVQFVEIQAKLSSARFVQEHLEGALLFSSRGQIQDYAADEAGARPGVMLEMGVYDGGSINRMSRKIWKFNPNKKVYGLDSFKGLEESWSATDHYKSFDVGGIVPKGIDSRVQIINGRVENVLQPFLKECNPEFALIHFDMDLYGPTYFALQALLPYLKSGTLILFDELYGYPGWEYGEFKALNKIISQDRYRYLAFGPIQCLIEII